LRQSKVILELLFWFVKVRKTGLPKGKNFGSPGSGGPNPAGPPGARRRLR